MPDEFFFTPANVTVKCMEQNPDLTIYIYGITISPILAAQA